MNSQLRVDVYPLIGIELAIDNDAEIVGGECGSRVGVFVGIAVKS